VLERFSFLEQFNLQNRNIKILIITNSDNINPKSDNMRLQLKIIELLADKPELTINQIAKQLTESYSFVNRTIAKMIKEGLILKEKIGHSILCRLNIKNDKTKVLIALNEVNKKHEFLKKNKELKLIADEITTKIEADSIAIFGSYAKNTHKESSDIDLFILTEKELDAANLARDIYAKYGKEISPIVMAKRELESQKDRPVIKEIIKYHIILKGFENFVNLLL